MADHYKSIVLLSPAPDLLNGEILFLRGIGYSIETACDPDEIREILNSHSSDFRMVIISHFDKLGSGWKEKVRNLIRDFALPVLFYCHNCDKSTLEQLNSIDHMGIIPAAAGLPYLEMILQRAYSSGHTGFSSNDDPLERLARVITETNRQSGRGEYGSIISGLLDAVIIDRENGEAALANNKACEILGLTQEEIITGMIYKSGWQFIHEDMTPFPVEEHTHRVAFEKREPARNEIMGINRPGHDNTLWISTSSFPVFRKDGNTLSGIVTTFYDISEYVAIRKNNMRLAAVFQSADWGIVISNANTGLIEQMNPHYAKMHGYSMNELMGKPVSTVIAPDDLDTLEHHIRVSMKRGHYRLETKHIRKDGTVFPTMAASTTIKDHNGKPLYRAVNVVDISLMKHQEKKLRESLAEKEKLLEELKIAKEYSDTLFSNSPIAIYSVDRDCKVVNFNRKAQEITGYSSEEVVGREFNMYVDDLQNNGSLGKEFRILTKDREEKIIERYSSMIYDNENQIVGDIESFLDITEWKKLQDYKSDVERIIRHDLKTPLNSIIGFPKLMLTDDSLSDEYREYLMIILLAGQNMLNLINASLNLYKLEQGTYQYSLEKTEVTTILRQIRRILKDDCFRKKCKIEFEHNNEPLDRDYVLEIITEKSFLYMILVNLIKNAVEASPKGEKILVSIYKGENLEINIHNKGAIPEEIRDRFFEKNVTHGKKQGHGLGTYSAKLMANAIHADLTFKTDENEGTTLFLKL